MKRKGSANFLSDSDCSVTKYQGSILFAVARLLAFSVVACLSAFFSAACQERNPALVTGESLSREVPGDSIRVCSQNLQRFGEDRKFSSTKSKKQKSYLVSRILRARCDVVALQEVVGKTETQSQLVLDQLVAEIELRSGRRFQAVIGKSRDHFIRNGFLFASDLGQVGEVLSHWREPLPKLVPSGPPRSYSRGPLEVHYSLKRATSSGVNKLLLIGLHLKSKAHGWKDPSGTNFELMRMEAAEGLRRIAQSRRTAGVDSLVIVLGDRNSPPESASADVLAGRRYLSDFAAGGRCRLSKSLNALCGLFPSREQELVGLFAERQRRFPGKFPSGSYRFKGRLEQIDEISVLATETRRFERRDNSLAIGFRGQFNKGSDHRLIWAEIQ